MTQQNTQRIRIYQDKLRRLEELPAVYPHPLIDKKQYEAWQEKYHKRSVLPKSLLKLIIP